MGARILVVVLVAGLAAGAGPGAVRADLAECVGDGPRPIFAGHNLPMVTYAGERPLRWVSAFDNVSFVAPVQTVFPPDDSGRVFVVEQPGKIQVLPYEAGAPSSSVFLDLSDRVVFEVEAGLVGLAFDPDFASNGRFYVNYVARFPDCAAPGLCTRIERFDAPGGNGPVDPDSGVLLLEYRQEENTHNGGMMAFGTDGLLYISSGDGGAGGDLYGNAQNLFTLRGGILRIDPSNPSGGREYGIPPGNPLAGNTEGWREELWAWGLRNPWRFSFDRVTGDLWIGDVGQSAWEEFDFVAQADLADGGFNFGWPFCEGFNDYGGNDCSSIESTPPRFEYGRDLGSANVGGVLYRGTDRPGLVGAFIFNDFRGLTYSWESGTIATLADNVQMLSSIGEDPDGEILATEVEQGRVLRLEENPSGNANIPDRLSRTGLFSNVPGLVPAPGLIEYELKSPLWSDRAIKRRFLALPGSQTIDFDPTGAWDFPVGTVLVKHFELEVAGGGIERLETRVVVRQNEAWAAWTYRWNPAQDEAFLVLDAETEDILVDDGAGGTEIQTWTYPAPPDCMGCHTLAEGRVLGVRTRQLNRDVACESTSESQLDAWNAIGLFSEDVGPAGDWPSYDEPGDATAPIGPRARAYLAANCGMCHQPNGPAPGGMDMRFDTEVAAMGLVDVPASEGDLGLTDPRRIAIGEKERSVLWHRQQSVDEAIRMARGTRLPDALAVDLFGLWIDDDLAADGDSDGVDTDSDNCTEALNADQLDTDADDYGNRCDCDFDNDLDCDGDDQSLFDADQAAGFDPGRGTDMDGDGDVDAADLVLLEAGLARGAPGPSFVPEPSAAAGAGSVLLALRLLVRGRRSRRDASCG